MKCIGVTGPVCSGKTTVAEYFRAMGACLIDADSMVHGLYRTDDRIIKRVRAEFGERVFTRGKIDRKKLASEVFKNRSKLQTLVAIVHPEVIKRIICETRKRKTRPTVIDAPLLFESGLHRLVDYVIVVRASLRRRLRRCDKRGLAKSDMAKRGSFMIPLDKKIKYADFIIDNDSSKNETRKAVKAIWAKITGGKNG
ncbi:MAG: dephospho-CoA kinase [Candidatus Omnitrophica bacterium]|nr:dephospho-CoA kinase [Candidatus Omnitrophota bacterium]